MMKKAKQMKITSFNFTPADATRYDLDKRLTMYNIGINFEEKEKIANKFKENALKERNIRYNQNRKEKRKAKKINQEVEEKNDEVIIGADEHKDNYDDNPVIDLLSDSSDEADETKLPKKSNRKSTNQIRPDHWAKIVEYYIQTNLNVQKNFRILL